MLNSKNYIADSEFNVILQNAMKDPKYIPWVDFAKVLRITEEAKFSKLVNEDGTPSNPELELEEGESIIEEAEMAYKDYYLNEHLEFEYFPVDVEKVALKKERQVTKEFNQKQKETSQGQVDNMIMTAL